jgi:hypothetical protein
MQKWVEYYLQPTIGNEGIPQNINDSCVRVVYFAHKLSGC